MTEAQARLEITDDGAGNLRVTGEIDAHSAPDLAERLESFSGVADRRLDMSGVAFMDSSGLRVLIDAHQRAEAEQSRLVLVAPGRIVSRIIGVSGLDGYLNVESADV